MKKSFFHPAYVYAIQPGTGELIIIGWGESTYVVVKGPDGKSITGEAAVQLMNHHNTLKGVTERQRDLVMAASMFNSWDSVQLAEAFGSKE